MMKDLFDDRYGSIATDNFNDEVQEVVVVQ